MDERLLQYKDWARACMHVRCGFCREICPSYSQFKLDSYTAKGRLTLLYHWLAGNLEPSSAMAQRVYACTSCGLCDVACGYPQSEAIQAMKTVLFDSGVRPPEDYLAISTKTRQSGNPYGESAAKAKKVLRYVRESTHHPADVTLFFGCTEVFRNPEQVTSVLNILRAANVNFGVFPHSICCGSPVLRVGDLEQARAQAEKLTEKLEQYGTRTVAVSCSGCYRTFTKDYPSLLGRNPEFATLHTVQLIDQLLTERRLALRRLGKTITYHDPCHLGRHAGVYDEPRRILKAIPGAQFVEMEWNQKTSKCCGAGGGLKVGRPDDAAQIAARRVQEAEATGASVLVTACPFCVRNLTDGAKLVKSSVEVVTLESLVAGLIIP